MRRLHIKLPHISSPTVVFTVFMVVVGVLGIFFFRGLERGTAEFPVTADEQLGIYLSRKSVSLEEILRIEDIDSLFSPYDTRQDTITASDRVNAWIRLPLTNPADSPKEFVLQIDYRWINLASFYKPDGEGAYALVQEGQRRYHKGEAMKHSVPAFTFVMPPGQSAVYYLKLQDFYWLKPSITLWDEPETFAETVRREDQFIHAYFGLIAGLFIANFCAYFAFRYPDLRYYLIYLASSWLLQLVNYNFQFNPLHFLFRDLLPPIDFNIYLFSGLLLLNGGLFLRFANDFLEIRKFAPTVYCNTQHFVLLLLAIAPVIAFGPAQLLGPNLHIVVSLFWALSNIWAFGLGIYAYLYKVRQSHYFLPALLLLFVVAWRFNAAMLSNAVITADILQQWLFASCLEMIIFTFGLLDRFLGINGEKQEAQAKALAEMQKRSRLQERFNEELSATVDERTQSLNRANTQKDRLLTFLAHDLRTPLSSLVSLSAMLARTPGEFSRSDIQSYAHEIEGNARNVSELMENLLSWGKLQSGELALQCQEYLVHDLFEAAHRNIKTQAELRAIEVTYKASDDLYAYGDFVCIVAVLRNLITNAIKFSSDGSVVRVGATESEGGALFVVEDEGPGLTDEARRMVEREERPALKVGSGGEAGSGLGLSICYGFLRLHGTRLNMENRLGQAGSRFIFELPKLTPDEDTRSAAMGE